MRYSLSSRRVPVSLFFCVTPEEFDAAIKQATSTDEFEKLLKAIILEKRLNVPELKQRPNVEKRLRAAEMAGFAPDYITGCSWSTIAKYALWKFEQKTFSEIQLNADELEQFKRELSQGIAPPYRDDQPDKVDDWLRWKIRQMAEDLQRQKNWDQLSEQQLAERIAERLPLYDKEKDRRQILELRQKLAALKKTELMILDEWTQGVEHMRGVTEKLNSMAAILA